MSTNKKTISKKGYSIMLYHNTFANDHILGEILKDGMIRMGSNIAIDKRRLSGGEEQPYVFANIEFADLNNLEHHYGNSTFIISPEILNDVTIYFNSRWNSYIDNKTIVINKDDDMIHKTDKLRIIHDYLKNMMDNKQKIIDENKMYSPFMNHEIMIPMDIDIKKYIIGIISNHDIELKRIIKSKGYDIKIIKYKENMLITNKMFE